MHALSSKEEAPGREELLHTLEGENEAAFASSLLAALIIQPALPLPLSASPLHGGGGDRRGVFFGFLFFFFIFQFIYLYF